VIGSYFNYLHRGIAMGETSGGRDSPATTLYPKTVSVSGSYFDRIGGQAIQGYEDSGPILSTGNTYENVGYDGYTYDELFLDPLLSPVTSVLEFAAHGSSSVNDSFYRSYIGTNNRRDPMVFVGLPIIKDNGFQGTYLNSEEGLQMGRMVQTTGYTAVLNDATPTANVITNNFQGNLRVHGPGTITYVAIRDEDHRTGSFRVTWNDTSGAVYYDDEYTESSDIGLTLTATFHEGASHPPIEVFYTTTNTGVDINLQYSIKYHTANNSPR